MAMYGDLRAPKFAQGFFMGVIAHCSKGEDEPHSLFPYSLCVCFMINRRPISSSVFGADALVTKPAVSIAPMIVVNILNRYGYQTIKQQFTTPSSEDLSQLHSVMFSLLCLVPVVLGWVQFIVWSWYPYKTTGQSNERTAT